MQMIRVIFGCVGWGAAEGAADEDGQGGGASVVMQQWDCVSAGCHLVGLSSSASYHQRPSA
jgi:hypothetical protein